MRRLLPALLLSAAPAAAEVELGFYGGWAEASDADVSLSGDDALPDAEASAGGGPDSQIGLRATYWSDTGFGVALDYSRFEGDDDPDGDAAFGDLSTLTLNGMRRFEGALSGVTPYVGAGLGLAMGEIEAGGATAEASGPAVSWVAGASVPLSENWSAFGEYEGTYADLEGDTDGGGTLETDAVTNSINLGVSFSF